jgi:hypothetical protein
MQAAPAQAIAIRGVVNIAALDVTPTKTCGRGDMKVGASNSKAEGATADEVAFREAEIWLTGTMYR